VERVELIAADAGTKISNAQPSISNFCHPAPDRNVLLDSFIHIWKPISTIPKLGYQE
jgi:hypothetical protein